MPMPFPTRSRSPFSGANGYYPPMDNDPAPASTPYQPLSAPPTAPAFPATPPPSSVQPGGYYANLRAGRYARQNALLDARAQAGIGIQTGNLLAANAHNARYQYPALEPVDPFSAPAGPPAPGVISYNGQQIQTGPAAAPAFAPAPVMGQNFAPEQDLARGGYDTQQRIVQGNLEAGLAKANAPVAAQQAKSAGELQRAQMAGETARTVAQINADGRVQEAKAKGDSAEEMARIKADLAAGKPVSDLDRAKVANYEARTKALNQPKPLTPTFITGEGAFTPEGKAHNQRVMQAMQAGLPTTQPSGPAYTPPANPANIPTTAAPVFPAGAFPAAPAAQPAAPPASPATPPAAPATQPSSPVRVANAQDYAAVPSGTQYLDSNGNLRMKK